MVSQRFIHSAAKQNERCMRMTLFFTLNLPLCAIEIIINLGQLCRNSTNNSSRRFRLIRKKSACPMKSMWRNWPRNCHKERTKHLKYWKKLWRVCRTSNFQIQFRKKFILPKLTQPVLIHRWKNYIIRGIFTLIMILGFCLIIYGGPLALMITVIFIFKYI